MPKHKGPVAEKIQLLLEGDITSEDGQKFGKSTYKVYEGLAGLEDDQAKGRPYLLVWLHGMDNGSIEPAYLSTLQKRLRHRVIFLVPMSPQTQDGVHFNWACAFRKQQNKKQLGFVHGTLHKGYLDSLSAKISDFAYEFDAERVLVMGYSMGGFGAFQLGGFAPDSFDVVISVAGYGLGTLEPENEMYNAPQPQSMEIFKYFLDNMVSELSRVPIVLGVHAESDTMSSFKDVMAIIDACKANSKRRNDEKNVAELFVVPEERANSDRNGRKKKISGHHYFNFSLLDDNSEEFLWSKLRDHLSTAPLRLELQPLVMDQPKPLPPERGQGGMICSTCSECKGPHWTHYSEVTFLLGLLNPQQQPLMVPD